jgi:hypothetical protein
MAADKLGGDRPMAALEETRLVVEVAPWPGASK